MKLIAEFARRISDKLVEKGIVQKEDAGLCQYGIENGITIAGNLFASVIFGIVTGRLGVVLVFLLFYSSLRSYSGGIHCKSRLCCFILSMLVLLVPVYSYQYVMGKVPMLGLIVTGAASVDVIIMLSPVESINKPLDEEERKHYRRISYYVTALQVCVLVFLICMDQDRYFYAGYSSLIIVAVFMVLGKIHAKNYT